MAEEARHFENAAVPAPSREDDIPGALGTIRAHDEGRRRSWRARLLVLLAVMGPGLIVMVGDNDAGGVATYAQAGQNFGLEPVVDTASSDPRPHRQPGDGGASGGRVRRRPRQTHQRALRQVLGRLLRRRPLRPQLPDDRHRVHRHPPRLGLLRRERLHLGAGGGDRIGGHDGQRQLPALGAVHARVRGGQLPGDPAGDLLTPPRRTGPAPLRGPRRGRRLQLDLGPAHHRHRGHDGGPMAAVLPAVEHRGQEDHAALPQLRARRHGARLAHHRAGRQPDHRDGGLRLLGHTKAAGHFTDALGVAHALDRYFSATPPARCSR